MLAHGWNTDSATETMYRFVSADAVVKRGKPHPEQGQIGRARFDPAVFGITQKSAMGRPLEPGSNARPR